jgi:penicillin-binding protein 1A
MPDSKDSFSAGERLSPVRRDPPRPPPRKPSAPRDAGKGPKKPRIFSRIAGFLVTSLYRLVFVGAVVALLAGIAALVVFSSGLPSVDSLKTYTPPLESRVYSDDFQLVSELGGQHCVYVPYDQIPPLVAQAFISAEDRLFWEEPGINPLAMIRAALTDVSRMGTGHRPQGASTITEQVVKNMLLDNRITFGTKIKEVLLAMRVSQMMTKQQVITLYLNEVDLGHNTFGIAAAAQTYFDKPLGQLDIAQAASLAALPKAPTNYDPFLHPQDALTRRNFIIGRMLAAISPPWATMGTSPMR